MNTDQKLAREMLRKADEILADECADYDALVDAMSLLSGAMQAVLRVMAGRRTQE